MGVKNISESASTIKNMWELLPADNWTLDKTILYCNYDNSAIVQDELILDKYYDYFSQYLVDIELDDKYLYNPQWFAYDYYGDSGLDFLVLYFSGCTSMYDFKKKNIKVFDYSHLKELNQLFTFYKDTVDKSKKNPQLIDSKKVEIIESSAQY